MPKLLSPKELGDQLKELRGELSLADFAALAGKPGQGPQFGKYERGKIPPSLDTLEAIADARSVPMAVFYEEEPTEAKPLTAQAVTRLRDRMRTLRDTADGVLAELEAALTGRITPSAKDAQTGETAMRGVKQEDARRNGEGKRATRAKRQGSRPAHAPKRDDP